jgi:cytoskeletal protein CcmA (bactofilin family)
MALKDFMGRNGGWVDTVEDATRTLPPAAPAPRTVSPSTSVDASSELEGTLRCKQTLRIDGCIRGEIECEKNVIVGECARVYASISGDEVQIAGKIEGDISACRKITLERSAVVLGNLTTPGIVIEEGAKLQGRIVIGSDTAEAQPTDPKRTERAEAFKKRSAAAAAPKPGEAVAAQPVATSA